MATALYAMAVNFDVTTQSGLRHLDDYLLTRYYISGYQPSLDDIAVYAALGHPPAPELVNLWRWYSQIHALLDNTFPGPAVGVVFTGVLQGDELPQDEATTSGPGSTTGSQTSNNDHTSAGTSASPNVEDGDYANGDLDHSGDHSHDETQDELNTMAEDTEASLSRARQQRTRSSVLLDVKPWDDETDMVRLEEAVRAVQLPGLHWGASKLVPVVGQINKLQIVMTIDDDLVSPDNLIEEKLTVEPANQHIQSCDIVAWNKLCKFASSLGISIF